MFGTWLGGDGRSSTTRVSIEQDENVSTRAQSFLLNQTVSSRNDSIVHNVSFERISFLNLTRGEARLTVSTVNASGRVVVDAFFLFGVTNLITKPSPVTTTITTTEEMSTEDLTTTTEAWTTLDDHATTTTYEDVTTTEEMTQSIDTRSILLDNEDATAIFRPRRLFWDLRDTPLSFYGPNYARVERTVVNASVSFPFTTEQNGRVCIHD